MIFTFTVSYSNNSKVYKNDNIHKRKGQTIETIQKIVQHQKDDILNKGKTLGYYRLLQGTDSDDFYLSLGQGIPPK